MEEIKNQLNKMIIGDELKKSLCVLPDYKNDLTEPTDRLLALLDVYKIFIPSRYTIDIYNKMYLSVINSLEKKNSILETQLINDNFRTIKNYKRYGIIGGLESFRITGTAGLGKTSNVQRCIDLISNNKVLIINEPYREIIPVLFVECVADGSFKSLLLLILIQIDGILGTNYYEINNKTTITIDMLLAITSNILINHVALLVIDEIERVANDSKKGVVLINYLTQLVNQCNISICFIGNESANRYFETKEYLSRRTIGISINKFEYTDDFNYFLSVLFQYQYVLKKVDYNSEYSLLFYKLTNGIPSMMVSLFIESQKEAILSGEETLTKEIIERTFYNNFTNMIPYLDINKQVSHSKQKLTYLSQNFESDVEQALILKVSKMSKKDTNMMIKTLQKYISVEYVKLC